MNHRWLDIALQVLRLPTAPLYESAVAAWLKAFARERSMSVREDRHGNLLIRPRGVRRTGRPLVFAAHMDHPGFGAGRMLDGRTLLAFWRGGVPPQLFRGARVRFFSRNRWVRGKVLAIGRNVPVGSPHPVRIRVDGPVAAGSPGMWDFPDPRVRGNLLYARGHDCPIGVAALASALDEIHRTAAVPFHAFFTRCEEGGFWGAIGACMSRSLPAGSTVVALEASMALPNARLGDGVVVRVGDRSSIFTPRVSAALLAAARALQSEDKRFKFQRRLMDGGTCESTVYCAYGYPSGGLCLPLRNYHNVNWEKMTLAAEAVDLRDYESLVRLIVRAATTGIDEKGAPRPTRRFEERFALYTVSPDESVTWTR